MIDIKVDISNLFRALTKAGFNLSIQGELSTNSTGSISMYLHEECEECEAECSDECACEVREETPNPFIAQHEQESTEMAKLGLSDFPYHEQYKIIQEAGKYIKEHGIDEDDHKLIVHHRMRDHYIAYKEYLKDR